MDASNLMKGTCVSGLGNSPPVGLTSYLSDLLLYKTGTVTLNLSWPSLVFYLSKEAPVILWFDVRISGNIYHVRWSRVCRAWGQHRLCTSQPSLVWTSTVCSMWDASVTMSYHVSSQDDSDGGSGSGAVVLCVCSYIYWVRKDSASTTW